MSKIGDAIILIPDGVTVENTDGNVVVKGPKGELQMQLNPNIKLEINDEKIVAKRKNDEKSNRALHGLTRSLVANMIVGVTNGWSKNLELVGVGFRAQTSGEKLNLVIGFSHPVEINAPEGISFEVLDNTKVKVIGIDKYLVGQVAANIRGVRPPDVYKGKGIRYEGEYVRKKAGKAGKVGPGATK
ncbi:MAG: 50S ribosomal protein L6 [Candidatus Daviesbacteria bacterium]|nr:50S ribosomal protein L6 [Candidatus Daviesbacteria bacterium]